MAMRERSGYNQGMARKKKGTEMTESTAPAGSERWRNRIVERVVMRVGDLLDHEGNPWSHPQRQKEQVAGLLEEVGKIDSIKAWRSERLNGRLATWDGHLRKSLDPDEVWPVDITDLTDEEADKVIALYNRTGAEAQLEGEALDQLLQGMVVTDLALKQMLDEMEEEAGLSFLVDAQQLDAGPNTRNLGDKRQQIKPVLYVDEIEVFEEALRRTGLANRGEAIITICQFYIDTHQ